MVVVQTDLLNEALHPSTWILPCTTRLAGSSHLRVPLPARLARNLSLDLYDELRTIVLYPSHYRHPGSDAVILGEAHRWGQVILSWDAVQSGLANPSDGHNTAVHEFAHVLDASDGAFDGTPELLETARRAVDPHPLAPSAGAVRVEATRLGDQAGLLGAALLARGAP